MAALREPIRIISDIHFRHPGTLVTGAEQLAPLMRGPATVVFNGDSVEMRFGSERDQGNADVRRLADLCRSQGAEPVFVNGNHDPDFCESSHLDLSDGAVLVTHGDILFYEISPWSHEAAFMREAHTAALKDLGGDAYHDFEKRLAASKRASLALQMHESRLKPGRFGRIATFLGEAWPPWRPLHIIKCWMETPGRAEALACLFRPQARFIVIGHTHFSGVWRKGPRLIINTGSFLPFSGRTAVDIEAGTLTIRAIKRTGDRFEPGRILRQCEIAPLQRAEWGRI